MKKSRLIELLMTFNATEWKRCNRYIKSQHLSGGDQWNMWKHIYNHRTALNAEILTTPQITQAIGIKESPSYHRKLQSFLLAQIETFLIMENWSATQVDFLALKSKMYYQRGLHKYGDRTYNQAKSKLRTGAQSSWSDSQQVMWIELQRYFSNHPSKRKKGKEFLFDIINSLEQSNDLLGRLLKLELHNRHHIHNETITNRLDNFIQSEPTTSISNILNRLSNILNAHDDDSIDQVMAFIKNDDKQYSDQIIGALVVLLANYLSSEIKQGRSSNRLRDLLELYDVSTLNGAIMPDRKIPLTRFITVLELAGVNHEINWMNDYSAKYIYKVVGASKNVIQRYTAANMLFYKGDYSNAYAILKDLRINNTNEELRRRELLCISAYEDSLGEININNDRLVGPFEVLESHLRNYNQWLDKYKTSIGDINFRSAKNLLGFINLLLKQPKSGVLKQYLSKHTTIRKRSWINNKIGF